MQKIKPSWNEQLRWLQQEMVESRLNRRSKFKHKFKLFWNLFSFCFLWKDSDIKLSIKEFPPLEDKWPQHRITKMEVDWTLGPEKLYRFFYADGRIETK